MREIGEKIHPNDIRPMDIVAPLYAADKNYLVYKVTASSIYYISHFNDEKESHSLSLRKDDWDGILVGTMEEKELTKIKIDDVEIGKKFLTTIKDKQIKFMKTNMYTNVTHNGRVEYKLFHCVDLKTGTVKCIKSGRLVRVI